MDSTELNQVWSDVCTQIKGYDNIDPSQINAFFSRLQPQAMSEGFLMVTADNDFIKTWIERHYLDFIKQALLDLYRVPFTVIVEVNPGQTAAPVAVQPAPAAGAVPTAQVAPAAASAGMQVATAPVSVTPASVPAAADPANSAVYAPAKTATATAAGFAADAADNTGAATPTTVAPAAADLGHSLAPEGPTPAPQAPQTSQTPQVTGENDILSGLTFENFVIGDSNRMAYSMAVSVAEMPGKAHLNPLFIYGKSGLGKTHLLRAIQNYVRKEMPHLRTVYVDSAELLADYTEASAAHDRDKSSFKNFKTHYEEADVLLIDDVQYLQGKKQTLDIVFQIFNKLKDKGKQVVLSADRAPKNIDIDERYKSRFNSGGTFDIQPPEIETKLGIVKSFIDEHRETEGDPTFSIPRDIQMYIAENSGSNIRELKSAVTSVIYQMSLFNKTDVTLDDVREILEKHFSGSPSKRLTIADVQHVVEDFYKVSHADLVSKKRTRNITYARQIGMFLCRQMLDVPFADIGKKFNRDHSSVMYGVDMVETKAKESREMREELETLRKIIRES